MDLKLIVTNIDNSKRKVCVDAYTMNLIEKAARQKTYIKKNGAMDFRDNIREFTDLIDTPYVIRNSVTHTSNFISSVDKSIIYRRVKMIADVLGYKYITTKNIVRSGMIYRAKQLIERDGELKTKQYREIVNEFNYKNIYQLRNFLTEDLIYSMYVIDGESNNKVITI